MMHRRIATVALAFTLLPAIAGAQTNVKSGFNLFAPEQDVEIGRQSAAEAERQLPIISDRDVQAYVDRIGRRLAQNAGGPNFPYTFRVVNQSDINAFALPGGPIYVNRGVIDNARNEGEVAGVMAHEIAHVALRHGTHQASKAYAAQAGLAILGGLLGGRVGSNTAQILNAVGGIGLNALFLKFSRELESQADVRGAQILAASGYAPADMVSFFHTLEKVDKSKKTTWLSDHPAPPDRIKRIEQEAKLLRVTDQPTTNVAELNQVKSELRGGVSVSSPSMISSSAVNNGTISVDTPSGTMRAYTSRSGLYRVNYPANWRVYEEGNGTGVTIAPEQGVGDVNGKTEVVYGAMINHYDPFNNSRSRTYLRGTTGNPTLQSATEDLLTQIQQSSPHLKFVRGSEQSLRVDGGSALAATMRGVNPNTRINERVTVVTRQLGDEHLLYMLFVTPEKDASNYSRVLSSMVNSMQIDENHSH